MSISEQDLELLYETVAAELARRVNEAWEAVIRAIEGGADPRQAVEDVLSEFAEPTASMILDGLHTVMQRSLGELELRDFAVGGITLSDRLYRRVRETEIIARRVIRDHAQFEHDVRELALSFFEGYEFRKREILEPFVGLPAYMRDAIMEGEIRALFARLQAEQLVTGPLRAGYVQALDAILEGRGQTALAKALRVAVFERYRYFANRIARTELARAHNDQISKELMEFGELEFVRFRLSAKHKVPDICDIFARQNAWGVGAGIYPKAACPKPPLHPFCRCSLHAEMLVQGPGRLDMAAARRYLRSLDPKLGAKIAGSRAKYEQIIAGVDAESVINAGRPRDYRIGHVGD